MVRTQIYLTEEENSAISRLSGALGQGKSELIRQAIDEFTDRRDTTDQLKKLRAGRGDYFLVNIENLMAVDWQIALSRRPLTDMVWF